MALSVVTSFRITATMTTFDFFPAARAPIMEEVERGIALPSNQDRHVEHPPWCAPARFRERRADA
jgi:hypothetical protein